MTTTIDNVTDAQIEDLRREARMAGDYLQVAICNIVLGKESDWERWAPTDAEGRRQVESMTRDEALQACVDAITDAEAQEP